MKKTQTEYQNDLRTLRHDLNSTVHKVEKIQELVSDLVEKLDGLYDHSVSAKDQAVDLMRDYVETNVQPKAQKRITAQHFRFLAILNEYGDVRRDHVGKLLGLKAGSVDQLACEIRKHHLADLRSRKGVYTLQALGDDVRENSNFKLV